MRPSFARAGIATLAAGLAAGAAGAAAPAPADRIAVLITDWAEPEGFDDTYRKAVVERSFGARAERPDEPCTERFVGEFPFRVQLGLAPMAVGFELPGAEGAYDSIGLYRRSEDGRRYVSIYDPAVQVPLERVPAELVTPAKDVPKPLERSLWAIDPRDGRNLLEGVYQIGHAARGPGPNPRAFPNGIRDADEYSYAAGLTDFGVLHEDLTPRLSPATVEIHATTRATLQALFGERIEMRFGAYAPTPGLMPSQDEQALDLARQGLRRFVLARETTDNNNYANDFMTRGYVERVLCKAGLAAGITYQQARQVGRTPEYNLALLHVAKQNLDNLPHGTEVAVLYTTYGLPFPGREGTGPFSAPHPWAKEVYHENAYNNYVAFKRYLEAYFGERYALRFNPAGRRGDARLDNYYSYGLMTAADFAGMDPAVRFRTLRENIDRAKREGRRHILAVLSHWYYNGRDPLLAVRVMQQIPLNTREDLRNGKHWVQWCERVDSPDPLPCDPEDPSLVHLQYSETFDRWSRVFGVGYAQVIRGAIERFGVYPDGTGLAIAARGPIDREKGGTVTVASGPLRGARLAIAADAHPGAPESFTAASHRIFLDPADNMVSAWDSFEGYVGRQNVPIERLRAQGRIASEPILFGPYRTIVNRPATLTLPVRIRPQEAERLRPFAYNDATEDWEPVFVPPGGAPLRYDAASRTASFDTQVLGVFALAVTAPGWTPARAVIHRPGRHAR